MSGLSARGHAPDHRLIKYELKTTYTLMFNVFVDSVLRVSQSLWTRRPMLYALQGGRDSGLQTANSRKGLKVDLSLAGQVTWCLLSSCTEASRIVRAFSPRIICAKQDLQAAVLRRLFVAVLVLKTDAVSPWA